MRRSAFGLCFATCCLLCAVAKTPATDKDESDKEGISDLNRVHVDDGGFYLFLPSDLTDENPAGTPHSYRSIPAFNPPHTAEEVGKDPCSHTLLLVGKGGDEASEIAARGSNKKKYVATPPSGGIAVVEIDDRCVKQLKSDDVLSRLAYEAQQVDGLTPTAQMISYQVDDHPVWLAMSSGFSKDEHGKRTARAGMTFVANASLSSQGHFFVLGMVSNDVELFNRMLKLRIRFSDTSTRLVPFELSGDTNRKDAVPK